MANVRDSILVDAPPELEAGLRIELRPEGEGTRWLHEMEFRMLPKFRPPGWLLEELVVRRKMQSDSRRILESGKDLIEKESREA